MTRHVATKWILGIIIYFIVLTTLLTSVNNFQDTYNIDDSSLTSNSGGSSSLTSLSQRCDSPRYDIMGEPLNEREGHCRFLLYSGLVYDQDSCESINGTCTWETSSFWARLWGASDYTCSGAINLTYYNNDVIFNPAGFDYVGATDNFVTYPDRSICELDDLQADRGVCQSWGCTWFDKGQLDEIDLSDTGIAGTKTVSNFFEMMDIVWDIFTLRVDFHTESNIINAILTLFLIWIPIIILLNSIYIMIR